MGTKESFGSVSLVRQGDFRFYSFTMPSDVLAETCFVVSRDEDPVIGFQRALDKKEPRRSQIILTLVWGLYQVPSCCLRRKSVNLFIIQRKNP